MGGIQVMNERYLYRAKRNNCEWIMGYILQCDERWFISEEPECDTSKYMKPGYWFGTFYEVHPSTICQCTGLRDKNGVLIWENDVVYARCNGLSGYGVIKYENGCFVLVDKKRNRTYSLFGEWKFRVDGSVFDNPELMEVQENEVD